VEEEAFLKARIGLGKIYVDKKEETKDTSQPYHPASHFNIFIGLD